MLRINKLSLSVALALVSMTMCDVSHLAEEAAAAAAAAALAPAPPPPPPPRPYAFSYTAGRFPGHADRAHSESGDGSGTIRGSYSYVDPSHQVRTVEYVADENGFHPALSHPAPAETLAVAAARDRHLSLFNSIAQDHALNPHPNPAHQASQPQETVAVAQARERHLDLFERIAAEHAQIGAEREALRLASPPQDPAHASEDYPQ